MTPERRDRGSPTLSADWPFPTALALGSAVRAKGIAREILHRLPRAARTGLAIDADRIALNLAVTEAAEFEAAVRIIGETLATLPSLPVLPSEAEDILTILPRERLKWLKDGRLKSAGTRTVKLRGRAKTVTFHIFEPQHIEDALDRDLPSLWREEDREASAEKRRRASAKAASARAAKDGATKLRKPATDRREPVKANLKDWAPFEAEGLLR